TRPRSCRQSRALTTSPAIRALTTCIARASGTALWVAIAVRRSSGDRHTLRSAAAAMPGRAAPSAIPNSKVRANRINPRQVAAVEPEGTRQQHDVLDETADIGPLRGAHGAIHRHEQPDRRVIE